MSGVISAGSEERERSLLSSRAIARLAKIYPAGTLDKVKQTLPTLDGKLTVAQEELDKTWLACRVGQASMEQFKQALDAWELANLACIKAVKG